MIYTVVKVNCLKYIVRNVTMFPFKTFLYIGYKFLTSKLRTMENSFLLIKKILVSYNLHNFFGCTFYLVYNKEFPLVYIIGWLHLLNIFKAGTACNPSYSGGRDQEKVTVQSQPGQNSSWDPILKKTHHKKRAGGLAQAVKHLTSKCETLSAKPSAAKKRKKIQQLCQCDIGLRVDKQVNNRIESINNKYRVHWFLTKATK
jgi:hypothetical protein